MAVFPSGVKAGGTNLSCRHCDERIDLLEIRAMDPENIQPGGLFQCPYCWSGFYPDIGLLHTLYREGGVGAGFFLYPLSLGGSIKRDLNHVNVGEHRPVQMHTLSKGYQYDSIFLGGAHRKGVEEEDWLDYRPAGAYNRATLGENTLINLVRTGPEEIAISATLQEDPEPGDPIDIGDELEVVYDASTRLAGVTNPPWIDLLQEAQDSIRQETTLAALPLLRSAVDNCLLRQMFAYLIWDGHTPESAREWIDELEDDYEPNRITVAKYGLKRVQGVRLTDGLYRDLWSDFSEVVTERDSIIHSETASHLEHINQATAVQLYNTTISLLVAAYDLFQFHKS